MADGQHKLSRRALLGAVCASPLIPRHPGLDDWAELSPGEFIRGPNHGSMNTVGDEPDAAVFMDSGFRRNDGEGQGGEWIRALARLCQAQSILDAARSEPDQDAYDALLDSHSAALAALLRSPAPDLPALAAKLDVIVPQQAWELTGSEDCLEILRRDAHRLAASAP